MDDNQYWHRLFVTLGVTLVIGLGIIFGYLAYQNYLTHEEIKSGLDPVLAACAHNTQPQWTKCPRANKDN